MKQGKVGDICDYYSKGWLGSGKLTRTVRIRARVRVRARACVSVRVRVRARVRVRVGVRVTVRVRVKLPGSVRLCPLSLYIDLYASALDLHWYAMSLFVAGIGTSEELVLRVGLGSW